MDRAMPLTGPEVLSFEFLPTEPDFSLERTQPFGPASLGLFERRQSARHRLRVRARITPEGHAPLETHTVDLSAHGLAVTSTRPLNVDQECRVELAIHSPLPSAPPVMRARVRYCAPLREGEFRIGMQFVDLSVEAAELIVAALDL